MWVGTSHGVAVRIRGKPLSVNSLVEAGVFRLDRWPLNFRAGSPVTSFGRHAGIVDSLYCILTIYAYSRGGTLVSDLCR